MGEGKRHGREKAALVALLLLFLAALLVDKAISSGGGKDDGAAGPVEDEYSVNVGTTKAEVLRSRELLAGASREGFTIRNSGNSSANITGYFISPSGAPVYAGTPAGVNSGGARFLSENPSIAAFDAELAPGEALSGSFSFGTLSDGRPFFFASRRLSPDEEKRLLPIFSAVSDSTLDFSARSLFERMFSQLFSAPLSPELRFSRALALEKAFSELEFAGSVGALALKHYGAIASSRDSINDKIRHLSLYGSLLRRAWYYSRSSENSLQSALSEMELGLFDSGASSLDERIALAEARLSALEGKAKVNGAKSILYGPEAALKPRLDASSEDPYKLFPIHERRLRIEVSEDKPSATVQLTMRSKADVGYPLFRFLQQGLESYPSGDYALVMDVSQSMAEDDIKPTRYAFMQSLAASFLNGLPQGSGASLVMFSSVPALLEKHSLQLSAANETIRQELSQAVVYLPDSLEDKAGGLPSGVLRAFTSPPSNESYSELVVRTMVNSTGSVFFTEGGTAIGDAVKLAADGLPRSNRTRMVMVFTDSDENAGDVPLADALEYARSRGVAVKIVNILSEFARRNPDSLLSGRVTQLGQTIKLNITADLSKQPVSEEGLVGFDALNYTLEFRFFSLPERLGNVTIEVVVKHKSILPLAQFCGVELAGSRLTLAEALAAIGLGCQCNPLSTAVFNRVERHGGQVDLAAPFCPFNGALLGSAEEQKEGVLIKAFDGASVKAAADGVVIEEFHAPPCGAGLKLSHGKDAAGREVETLYCHLREPLAVRAGAFVKRGDEIGSVAADEKGDASLYWAVLANGVKNRTAGFYSRCVESIGAQAPVPESTAPPAFDAPTEGSVLLYYDEAIREKQTLGGIGLFGIPGSPVCAAFAGTARAIEGEVGGGCHGEKIAVERADGFRAVYCSVDLQVQDGQDVVGGQPIGRSQGTLVFQLRDQNGIRRNPCGSEWLDCKKGDYLVPETRACRYAGVPELGEDGCVLPQYGLSNKTDPDDPCETGISGYTSVSGPPSVPASFIVRRLKFDRSPVADEEGIGQCIYDEGIKSGIDPKFAMAWHTVTYATKTEYYANVPDRIAYDFSALLTTRNVFKLPSSIKDASGVVSQAAGGLKKYASYCDSVKDWYDFIRREYVVRGVTDTTQILSKYPVPIVEPRYGSNEAYQRSVEEYSSWQAGNSAIVHWIRKFGLVNCRMEVIGGQWDPRALRQTQAPPAAEESPSQNWVWQRVPAYGRVVRAGERPADWVWIRVPVTDGGSQKESQQSQPDNKETEVAKSQPDDKKTEVAKVEARIHQLINEKRTETGAQELALDPTLSKVARDHSEDMGVRRFFSHCTAPRDYNPVPESYHDEMERRYREHAGCAAGELAAYDRYAKGGYDCPRGAWENIVYGEYSMPKSEDELAQRAVDSLMNSPGHRENLLNPDHAREGIGVYVTPDRRVYVTQDFC